MAPPKRRASAASRAVIQDFSGLYTASAARILRFLARRTLNPDVAVDLMAETFAQAFEHRSHLRGTSPEETEAWLFGIARHLANNYLRRGAAEQRAVHRLGLRVPALSDDDHARIEELADLRRMRSSIKRGLSRLTVDQRDAVRLRVVDELPYADVARRLRISEQTARARVSRGIRELARALSVESAQAQGSGVE